MPDSIFNGELCSIVTNLKYTSARGERGGNVPSILCRCVGAAFGVGGLLSRGRGLLAPGLLARVDLVAEAEGHSLRLGADADVAWRERPEIIFSAYTL